MNQKCAFGVDVWWWSGLWFGVAYWLVDPIGSPENMRVGDTLVESDDWGFDQYKVFL